MDINSAIIAIIIFLVGLGVQFSGYTNIYVAYFCWLIGAFLILYASRTWLGINIFQYPWGLIPVNRVAQNLYDELITSNMANNFRELFVNPYNSHDETLNRLGECLANENIIMYGKPPHSAKMVEIENLQDNFGNLEFRDGAASLCFLNRSEEFGDLYIKRKDAKKVITKIIEKMPNLLT